MGPKSKSSGQNSMPDLARLCRPIAEHALLPMVAVEGSTALLRYVNPAFCQLLGRKCEDLIGKPFAETVPEEEREACLALLDRVYQTGTAEIYTKPELAQPYPDSMSYVMWPIPGGDECPLGVLIQVSETTIFHQRAAAMNQALLLAGIRQHELTEAAETLNAQLRVEIEERKRVEEALRASEERFRVAQELSPDGFTILSPVRDAEGHVVDFTWIYENATIARLNGTDPKSVVGRSLLELFPGHQGSPFLEVYQQVAETGESRVLEAPYQGDSIPTLTWFRIAVVSMGTDIAILAQDITEHKQAEGVLRASEQDFRALAETVPQIVWATRPDGWNIYFNQRWVDYTGLTLEESYGHGWLTPFHPDDKQRAWESWQRATQHNEPYSVECRLRRADGVYRWWLIRGEPIRSANGEIQKWFGTCTDIEDIKQAEEALRESEERYRGLFSTLIEGFCIIEMVFDGQGKPVDYRFLLINPAFEEQTGLHDAQGKLMRDLAPDHEAHWFEIYGRVALTGEPARFVNEAKALGRWFDVSAYRVGGADSRKVAILFNDITEAKQAEDALLKYKDELEQRVEERTAELAARAQQLRLLASELTLAEQRERGRLAQVLHDGLQQVLVASRMRLARIEHVQEHELRDRTREVDDLLAESIEISRSLTAELSPPILREGGLVPGLEWLARWMNDKQGLSVIFDARAQLGPMSEDLIVLLFQATRELLFNVVKHAQVKEARVQVDQHGNSIQITVTDKGVGFNPDRVKQHGAGGGFGLFSIRERLELFGGQFVVLSAPGDGCDIVLSAPLIAPTTAPTVRAPLTSSVAMFKPPEPRDSAKGNVIRVMLVDDHLVMRQGIKMLIRDNPDMDVIGEASDGRSAVELARQIQPDVILMDISMPGMNGIEATRIIHAELPKVRIIGLSMFQEEDQAKAMREAGASDYLAKSNPSAAMLAAIRRDSGSNSPWFQNEE